MTRVAWSNVCRPLEDGGQGLRRMQPLNQALMSRHFWDVVRCNVSSVWVNWIIRHYLKHGSICTTRNTIGSWSWRKILKLCVQLLGHIKYWVSTGDRFMVWHDPWHPLGHLIHRFPRGPLTVGIPFEAKLHVTINEDGWNWPLITDIQHMEIMEMLPPLAQTKAVTWPSSSGDFSIADAYRLFQPPGPRVDWYVLLLGPFRIPRNYFILWLAILGWLTMMDRTWWPGPIERAFYVPVVRVSHTTTCSFIVTSRELVYGFYTLR
ncbi:UNVERIFIED_CONTAM: hypothetical protein Slati_1459400 [Sesamum latifolium]|uniref:Reverse transcriptase zinc-binding domain-containing protein n=1 Tax=Sesamum latifolium TaxID=2727402 RepID=A0AAW2X6C7_9LAMI